MHNVASQRALSSSSNASSRPDGNGYSLRGAPSPSPALAVAGAASASPAPMGKGPPRPCQRAVLVPWPSASASDGSSRSSPSTGAQPGPPGQSGERTRQQGSQASLPIPGVPHPPPAPAVCPPPFCAQPLRHRYNKSAQISGERLRTPRYRAPAFHPLTPHGAAVLPMPTRLTAGSRLRPTRFSTQPPVSTPKKLPPPKSCTHARLSSLCEPSCVPRACVPPAPRSRGGTEKGPEQLSPGRGCSCVYSGIYCKTQAWV